MDIDKVARRICTALGVSVEPGENPDSFTYQVITDVLYDVTNQGVPTKRAADAICTCGLGEDYELGHARPCYFAYHPRR